MQSSNLDQTIAACSSIAENVFVPHTEEEDERRGSERKLVRGAVNGER